MTTYKKLRGHKRIWKSIEVWKQHNLELDLETLKTSQRDYVKIWVSPYKRLSLTNSVIPEPKGKTKKLILEGLLDIYDSWKAQLETLNEPFYLKLWLYEPNVSQSQVVCAIGDFLKFYETTFFRPQDSKTFITENYGTLQERLKQFNWDYALDEIHFSNEDIEASPQEYVNEQAHKASMKWYRNQLKKQPRITQSGKDTTFYSVSKGTVWLGGK